MNEQIKEYLERVKKFLGELSVPKRIGIGAAAASIAIAGLVALSTVNKDPYQTLYSDLTLDGSKSVAKKLGELKIPHQISDDGKSISVPKSQVHIARMELAKEGLPGEGVVGFETFDNFSFGTSSYVQRIQYVRAVQGELTRSIQRIEGVKRARVHISMPPKKTFLDEAESPKASVVLELKPGRELSKTEINSIAHVVASAVEGLEHKHVTIVDAKGKFLHRPEDEADAGKSAAMLDLQRSIEADYEKRIEDLLTPVVGMGKVIAKVTAELDASKVNTMEETFDGEKSVPQNILKNDEVNTGSRPNPLGIPGSRSNLPGAEVETPPIPRATMNNEKNVSNTKFVIPRKVQTTDKPSGGIKRLTVAVVVDGTYQPDPGAAGKEIFTPRPEAELQRFKDIVTNAVGYDDTRRDSVTISSLPFKGTDFPEESEPTTFNWKEFIPMAIRNGLIGLVLVLFFTLVLRPFLRWATLGDVVSELAVLPKTVAELQLAQQDNGILALKQSIPVLTKAEIREEKLKKETEVLEEKVKKEEENKKLEAENRVQEEEKQIQQRKEMKTKLINEISEKLQSSPKKGYQILREWFEEDKPSGGDKV